MRNRNLSLLPIVLSGLMAACSTRTVLKPNPQSKTSYEMVVPKGVPRYTLGRGERRCSRFPKSRSALYIRRHWCIPVRRR